LFWAAVRHIWNAIPRNHSGIPRSTVWYMDPMSLPTQASSLCHGKFSAIENESFGLRDPGKCSSGDRWPLDMREIWPNVKLFGQTRDFFVWT
jgi:hypothetical protein